MTYGQRLKRLKALGLPGRAIAEVLGVNESTVSRLLRNEKRAEKFFRRPERQRLLEELERHPEEVARRWLLARIQGEILRRYPWMPQHEREQIALNLAKKRAPQLFS